MLLRQEHRRKLDSSNDLDFYGVPRFVTHVDGSFIDRLTQLYRKRLQPGTRVLDLMSSWVSHLPDDISFERVDGHGMNAEELARNPRLDRYFVQDLNENPKLPLPDSEFAAVLNTVSVQYLQYPEAVFSEVRRVLAPGGIAIVSFSNRMFFQKAIAAWRDSSEAGRVELVRQYFQAVPGFGEPDVAIKKSAVPPVLQMLGIGNASPFYAVLATKVA
ncbi:methylase involved in ubiquinone/menaquinone biosynthesis [Rubidibacter lacunae KORDI 51-2]|uniref:Methylase involved in ubiquinone/menaquinone biosynthesis n=1 Tax=Rubidibacter lacunae KORDI 51-2 TaxID=582515 RepID=U5DPU1_9CHRO|nr:methyltransferase domain-containing protein [Rubidibacter lacunae]ERN42887.1 methylase involved in ubiquinone/menaquinone biosynthesis [Rubidibacter lacunae KORDI 51-2]